jgi:trimeric autotransporter adhesin
VSGNSTAPYGFGVAGRSPYAAIAGFSQLCGNSGCVPGPGTAGEFFTGTGGTLLQGFSGSSFSTLSGVFSVDATGKGYFNGGVQSNINSPSGNAVVGTNRASSGSGRAVIGYSYSPNAAGIGGYNKSGSGGTGVYGENSSLTGNAIQGNNTAGGTAGQFNGSVNVTGNLNVSGMLTASTKLFRIDDPLDPEQKYLYHASIESSEMANVYSGNVVLDRRGEAIVNLPEWFEAVNCDFRYQLTAIGRAAQVYVAHEIQNHSFKIAGGRAGTKVPWQVTGVRHDSWAQAHPLQVESKKTEH